MSRDQATVAYIQSMYVVEIWLHKVAFSKLKLIVKLVIDDSQPTYKLGLVQLSANGLFWGKK